MRQRVADYLEETELTKKPKTLAAYSTALTYFTESCHKLNLEDIDRMDLLKFCAFLRDEKEQSPRSVYNKFESVMTFLKANGIRGLVGKTDWPRYTEEEPEMYEKEELGKLFAALEFWPHWQIGITVVWVTAPPDALPPAPVLVLYLKRPFHR